ncbi:MAG TPA: tetratricopeptide repeat protein [Ktedonobacterales bacterium]|nr:tetratricopeptide repeat protein [Ktedonobacterales bacterium]
MSQNDAPDPISRRLERLPTWILVTLVGLGLGVAAAATAILSRVGSTLWPDVSGWLLGAWAAYLQLPLGQKVGIGLFFAPLIALILALIPTGKFAGAITTSRARRSDMRAVLHEEVSPVITVIAETTVGIASGVKLLEEAQQENRLQMHALFDLLSVTAGQGTTSERYTPPNDRALLDVPVDFIGQDEPLGQIHAALDSASAYRGVWVYGPSGIGKTSTAASVVRNMPIERFPDGMAYIDCLEITGEEAALRKVIQRFDANRVMPPAKFDVLPKVIQTLLGEQRTLIVLDNVPQQDYFLAVASTLTGASPQSRVIVLSSSRPSSEGAAQLARVEIKYLTTDQAVTLFLRCYGMTSEQPLAEEDRAAVLSIVEALGNFQLAVSQWGRQAQLLGMALPSLAEQLKRQSQEEPPERLQDERVRQVYQRSLDTLAQEHADAAKLLTAWAAFGAPTIGRRALEAMASDLGIQNPLDALTTLRTWLLAGPVEPETLPPGSDTQRWQTHRLMYDHVSQRFKGWSSQEQQQAQTSALKYLAQYMKQAPESAIAIDQFAAVKSLTYALSVRSPEFDLYAVLLGVPIARFWRSRWDNPSSLSYLPKLIAAANRVVKRERTRDNLLLQADLNLLYGRAIRFAGKLPEAERYFKSDRKIRKRGETRDRRGEAESLYHLGQLYRIEGHMRAAEKRCMQALTLANLEHDEKLRGLVLGEMGRIARIRGRTREAQGHFEDAFKLLSRLEEPQDAGVMLGYLGRIARLRGQFDLSARYFEESERLAQVAYDRRGQGVVFSYLGRIKRTQGQLAEAKQFFDKSLQLAREAGDTATEAVVLGYRGRLLYTDGQLERAREDFRNSYHLSRSTWDGQNAAMMAGYLGRVRRAQGHSISGLGWRVWGLLMVYRVGDKRGQALSYRQLARFALQLRLFWLASWLVNHAEVALFDLGDRKSLATAELLQAEIAVGRGEFDAAKRKLDRCQFTFARLDDKVNFCNCLYFRARMADAERDTEVASDYFQQAHDVASNVGAGDAGLLAKITYYWGVSKTRRPETRAEGKADKRLAKTTYRAMGARRLPEPVGWPRRRPSPPAG